MKNKLKQVAMLMSAGVLLQLGGCGTELLQNALAGLAGEAGADIWNLFTGGTV